jgi:hypothetical protein
LKINNGRTQEKNLVELGYVIRTIIIYDLHLVSFLLLSLLCEGDFLRFFIRLAEEINIFRKEMSAKEMKPSANRR